MNTKKRVGVWVRVSTEDQKNGDSPQIHLERAKLYAELHNYEIVEVYDLSGISGKTVINTAQAETMLYHIKHKHIEGLIFSKIARFARNTRELLDFADYFKQNDASLISLQESFDSSTPSGKLFFTFISAIAEWEREEIVDRVNSSLQIRAKMGKRLGGKVPYGYTWEDEKLTLHPEEAAVRKLVFELFLQEKRKKVVASILNERGYITRGGKKFHDTHIERWIRDPLSKGLRLSNHTTQKMVDGKIKTVAKDKEDWYYHEAPAIVDDEVWQKANDILDDIKRKRTKPLNRKVYIFTQFIFCKCGAKMQIRSGRKFYRCSQKGCRNKIEKDQLEQIFKEQLKNYVSSQENIEKYLSLSDATVEDKEILLKSNMDKKDTLKKKVDALIDLYTNGQLEQDDFKSYHDPIKHNLEIIEKEVANLQHELKNLSTHKNFATSLVNQATLLYDNWDSFDQSKKRQLVEMITERITIGKDDTISIKLYRIMPNATFFESESNGQRNP